MGIATTVIRKVRNTSIRKVLLVFVGVLFATLLLGFAVTLFTGISDKDLAMNEKAKENSFSVQLFHPDILATANKTQLRETRKVIEDNLKLLKESELAKTTGNAENSTVAEATAAWTSYLRKYVEVQGSDTEARTDFVNLSSSFEALADDAAATLSANRTRQKRMATVAFVLALVSLVLIVLFFRNNIFLPTLKIARLSERLSEGHLEQEVRAGVNNEIGSIAKNVNVLANMLRNADAFTKEIGNGNLDTNYTGLEDNKVNHLATSLIDMRDKMKQSAEDARQRRWVTEGLARFSEILRKNNNSLEEMADSVISNLVKYLEANQGAFFVIDDESGENAVLQMKAAYAYQRKKFITKTVEKGQGLVGQVFAEQETIYLTEVPSSYVEIRSGLGDAVPRSILIVPLKVNGETHGVIEIAAFSEISEYRREFVEKLGETIASTISTVKVNEQTSRLYQESQELTEQLRAQEEEMRQNMEEMQATQEEMRRTQQELGNKEANLSALINNTTDSIVTVDREYKVMVINKVLADRYKGTPYEGMGVGKNVLDYLGDVREEWKAYYDRALAGERLQFTIKSSVQGEDSYREYNIHPIKVSNGDIAGASVFSRDVTEQKLAEIRSKEILRELKHKDNLFSKSFYFMELDHNLAIMNINEHFANSLDAKVDAVCQKPLSSLLPAENQEFVEVLKNMAGEDLWQGEVPFRKGEGQTILFKAHATFIDDEDDRLDKYVVVLTELETTAKEA